MNYPAASYGVSKTPRNEASFGEYDPKRFKVFIFYSLVFQIFKILEDITDSAQLKDALILIQSS
jgi:hypothetical protein